MELTIQKWGNSAAVRLPTELLCMLKVTLGDKLSVNIRPDGILLRAARPMYILTDLVAQCDLSTPEPADMSAWASVAPVGRETW
jgi:antitoxin ChpS